MSLGIGVVVGMRVPGNSCIPNGIGMGVDVAVSRPGGAHQVEDPTPAPSRILHLGRCGYGCCT